MAAVPAETLQLQQRIDDLARELDDREKIWASGYLSGLAAAGSAVAQREASATPTAAAGPQAVPSATASGVLNIWYGSETGNARRVADGLAEQARAKGLTVKLSSLADVRPQQLRKQELLTLVVSTHGEGDPPEDAEAFHEYLSSDKAPRLEQLSYAVFALGDSSYEHFCQTGKDLDAALERLGARRLLDRVDADVDFEDAASQWQGNALAVFEETLSTGASQQTPSLVQASPQGVSAQPSSLEEGIRWTRDKPFEAEVLASQPLTVAPSAKSVHHIELSIEDSGIEYQAGDSVGIWTDNATALVDEVLALTGLDGEQPVTRKEKQQPLRRWLSEYLELTRLSRPFLEQYAEWANAESLKALLGEPKALREWIEQHQVVDVLKQYPADIDAETLVRLLPGITPRMYSIASSPSETPEELHLTVKTVGGQEELGLRAGAASWYLNERLAVGDRVKLFVEPNPRFRLPEDGDVPVIMIGPGTGVAPFRAFVQERQARGHAGRNWLFFGEQHRRSDFLYQLEWQRHLKQGGLDRISLAFSRDQTQRIYVQDRIREAGSAVYEWLESGAYLYVCGDAKRMAVDVDAALTAVVADSAGMTLEQAQAYLKTLRRDGRYQKDVY